MSSLLIPIRTMTGSEPVVIAPYENPLWATTPRLKQCEIFALPEGAGEQLYAPMAWLTLRGRDVTFWPIDVWSSHVMTLVVQALTWPVPPNGPMAVIRWAWGVPWAAELGEPEAVIETIWRRAPEQQARRAAE